MRVPKVAAAVSIVLVLGVATPVVAHPGNEWSTGPIPHDRVPHVHDDAPHGSGPATPPSTNDFQILSHLALPGRASDADIASSITGGRASSPTSGRGATGAATTE